MKLLNKLGYLCIVLTNQPIIEKGIITLAQSDRLNETVKRKFLRKGARLHAFYTCPHKYGTDCSCRKPDVGLIKQAVKDFGIDLKKSFLIGDTTRDNETGRRADITTILVKTGKAGGGEDAKFFKTKADYMARNVLAAAKIIESLTEK